MFHIHTREWMHMLRQRTSSLFYLTACLFFSLWNATHANVILLLTSFSDELMYDPRYLKTLTTAIDSPLMVGAGMFELTGRLKRICSVLSLFISNPIFDALILSGSSCRWACRWSLSRSAMSSAKSGSAMRCSVDRVVVRRVLPLSFDLVLAVKKINSGFFKSLIFSCWWSWILEFLAYFLINQTFF